MVRQAVIQAGQAAHQAQARVAAGPGEAGALISGGSAQEKIPDMVNISARPVEADDRAVPGFGEDTVT